MTRLVVIHGSSGVGKSTLARALQEALLPRQWLHFSVDTLFYCLPRSVTARVDHDNDHALVDANALVAGAHACTSTLLDRGHSVIFDAVIAGPTGAERLMADFGTYQPLIVALQCSWPEIERRTLARGDRTLAEARQGFERGGGQLAAHHSFDTTGQSPQHIAAVLAATIAGTLGQPPA